MTAAVSRFLAALSTETDRRVPAPSHLREIADRLLQADRLHQLVTIAAAESHNDPVTEAARYMRADLARASSVREIAEHVT